jgi:hypothetical protein
MSMQDKVAYTTQQGHFRRRADGTNVQREVTGEVVVGALFVWAPFVYIVWAGEINPAGRDDLYYGGVVGLPDCVPVP